MVDKMGAWLGYISPGQLPLASKLTFSGGRQQCHMLTWAEEFSGSRLCSHTPLILTVKWWLGRWLMGPLKRNSLLTFPSHSLFYSAIRINYDQLSTRKKYDFVWGHIHSYSGCRLNMPGSGTRSCPNISTGEQDTDRKTWNSVFGSRKVLGGMLTTATLLTQIRRGHSLYCRFLSLNVLARHRSKNLHFRPEISSLVSKHCNVARNGLYFISQQDSKIPGKWVTHPQYTLRTSSTTECLSVSTNEIRDWESKIKSSGCTIRRTVNTDWATGCPQSTVLPSAASDGPQALSRLANSHAERKLAQTRWH